MVPFETYNTPPNDLAPLNYADRRALEPNVQPCKHCHRCSPSFAENRQRKGSPFRRRAATSCTGCIICQLKGSSNTLSVEILLHHVPDMWRIVAKSIASAEKNSVSLTNSGCYTAPVSIPRWNRPQPAPLLVQALWVEAPKPILRIIRQLAEIYPITHVIQIDSDEISVL
jgi:hypothetical protein